MSEQQWFNLLSFWGKKKKKETNEIITIGTAQCGWCQNLLLMQIHRLSESLQ